MAAVRTRNAEGLSITELLVSTILMSFCFAVIGELVVLNTLAATKLTNKTDGLTATRFAIERIKSDVRIGNTFVQPTNPSENYTSLIIQQPVFYKDSDPDSSLNGLPIKGTTNTVTYRVIADTQNPGEFVLQVEKTSTAPVTILKGIVGPKDPSDLTKLKVFRYIESKWTQPDASDPVQFSAAISTTDPPTITTMYGGVAIDLEVKRGSDTQKQFAATFGSHTEAFLKYNRNAEVTN